MDKRIGKLGYNKQNDRFGILIDDLWADDGLHCGECFEIFVDGEWSVDRIEFSSKSNEWYLVYSKLSGDDLERLKVRF